MARLNFSKKTFLNQAVGNTAWYRKGEFEPGAEHFLKAYYDDAVQNDALRVSCEDLLLLASEFWMLGQTRKVGKSVIKVHSIADISGLRDRFDVVELITDDSRFLVDSVIGEISNHGVDVVALFHPIVPGSRDDNGGWISDGKDVSESMIQVLITRQTTKTRTEIKRGIAQAVKDLGRVIKDFNPMLSLLDDDMARLKKHHGSVSEEALEEACAFLEWIRDGNFVFLGSRTYNYQSKRSKGRAFNYASPSIDERTCLGVLRDKNNTVLRQSSEPSNITSNFDAFIGEKEPVTVAKSNMFSRVHRHVRMDYVSLKHYTIDGRVKGETRYVGLFTADAYERSPKFVPLVRRKIQKVIEKYGADPASHNGKRLDFVLSTYPRDELFQCSEKELYRISTGVAQAFDRPRTRLFVREDTFKRFVSALIYVPREHYNSRVRHKIGNYLAAAYGGRVSAFYPQYSDSPLARVHFIIGLDPDSYLNPKFAQMEKDIATLSEPWGARLRSAADERGDIDLIEAAPNYQNAFTPAYQTRFGVDEALDDMGVARNLSVEKTANVRVYRRAEDEADIFRVKFYSWGTQSELSDVMPIFGNMGLHVIQETSYQIMVSADHVIWMNDYKMRLPFVSENTAKLASVFCEAMLAVYNGENEDDGFNALVLQQSVDWRQIALLRLLSRYRKQSGLDPSEEVQIAALARYPAITGNLLKMFVVKFDPTLKLTLSGRKTKAANLQTKILQDLDSVRSLDHDHALRRITNTLSAALRTNFFIKSSTGQHQPFISVKLDSGSVGDLPAPCPYREIFVWSPRVEGVHLRFGPVSRGGLRWSDRRDDFRTEVLGLVKAQQVKNTVIVPVGSKGGFYPKNLPVAAGRDAVVEEGIAAYKQFISGMLDITDTYKGKGVKSPKDVVCWDEPDPYLVVAADKGTATFSDIANEISQKYGFWLGDAFASGGSVGYDHKAMGITARGGWEAVKRHFRELDKDIQNEEFDVIGIGDMSGDVFGNGMLLSEKIRLLVAFDHRDIFIDPSPAAAKTFKERQRLFETPGTTWQNFNKKLISKGGGVFSRQAKSITLTPEIQKMSGLGEDAVAPNELIKALLTSPCELLWFGGIGTYIKAASESHGDVRDKANDPIRVNGSEIKAQVIGEGANLGVTQSGRIEFARNGGHVNTDAIDNSAGVDCSDNEVNIKILLSSAIDNGELKASKRDKLLAKMTDDVADLVLQHNYDQTSAISLAEMQAREDHSVYARFMDALEAEGMLDRHVELLPTSGEMQSLAAKGEQLSRPELAVLNAYAKLKLYTDLVETDIAKDPYFESSLLNYFPKAVRGFDRSLRTHRLRQEIIVSRLCNQIVDVGGPLFMSKLSEQTNAEIGDIATAFAVAHEVLRVADIRAAISELDNKVSASAQLELHEEIELVLQRVIGWLVRHPEKGSIAQRVARRTDGLAHVDQSWINVLSTYDSRRASARIGRFVRAGIPMELAQDVALMRARASGFDVVALTERTGWPVRKAAELFYDVGSRFKIDRLRAMSMKSAPDTYWEKLAQKRIEEDFYEAQASLAIEAAKIHIKKRGAVNATTAGIIEAYVNKLGDRAAHYDEAFTRVNSTGSWTLAKFAIINAQIRELLGT